jgi:hypothetical protein
MTIGSRVDQGFKNAFEDFERKVNRRAVNFTKKIARYIFRRAIDFTPVDTGRARASWTLSVVKPIYRDSDPEGKKKISLGTATEISRSTESNLSKYRSLQQEIYITNGAPYIRFVENGSRTIEAHQMLARAQALGASYARGSTVDVDSDSE